MDLDFFYYWGEFLKCLAGVLTFLFMSKIHPNAEITDRNLSPSRVVTFLYVGTCCWHTYVCIRVKICEPTFFQVATHFSGWFENFSGSTTDHENNIHGPYIDKKSVYWSQGFFKTFMADMISSYFLPTFEFFNSDSAQKRLLKWLQLNSRRFSNQ